ncbi:MAG: four helix bundle protein [Halioglobus sp.]|nr:four helix bundle protein [Halioglobus sp.]
MSQTYKDLVAWEVSIDLVTEIYAITASFPQHEKYGLASQLRRASVSVPSNIAEGAARHTKREFVNYLYIVRGSLAELQTQLLIASRLGYLESITELERSIERVHSLLAGLIRRNYS